jgi:Delta3-Delta2-enoyl-CoA isomerase
MLTHRLIQSIKILKLNSISRQLSTTASKKCQFIEQGNASRELVLLNVDDKSGYATLSLNRPPVNTINLELLLAFSKALDDVEEQKCRGMILTSVSE